MTATFLITLDLDDTSPLALNEISEDLHDDLEKAGHEVESVKPWARTGLLAPAIPSSLPAQQTQTQQT